MLMIVIAELELLVITTGNAALVIVICVPTKLRLVGFAVSRGVTVSMPIAEVAPVVAVTVTGVLLLTAPPVTMKVCEFIPAATITEAGTGATIASPLLRLTVSPPVGAFPLSFTVPVVICPEDMLCGLKDSIVTTGGITVKPPPDAPPLGNVAVMVTGVLLATGSEVAVNVPLLADPAILKLAGTVAALVLLLISVMVKPAVGAGPLRTTVAMDELPPVTELGLNEKDMITGGFTVKVPLALLEPSVAFTITFVAVGTPVVVAVNVPVVLVAATVAVAGTVTDGSPLLRDTVIPPVGAAWLRVTVPVELVPPVTAAGLKVTDMTDNAGNTVTDPLTVVVPVVAITVTGVELATDPPVTMNV